MKIGRNMGTTERWLRVLGGLASIVVGIVLATRLPVWVVIIIIILGVTLAIEAALSWCPLKAALGLGKQYQKK